MNLMIFELLLMKLHVHDMYKWVYCDVLESRVMPWIIFYEWGT